MQVPDNASETFPRILQTLADLMSQHKDIREIDGSTLSQCDEELDALRSVRRQLEHRVVLVCQKRNTFAPVNALPPELLVTIFKIFIDSDPGWVWSGRETLMLVCHHWNHLLNNTPSLWTMIENPRPSDAMITRALEISKDSPLEIYYCETVAERALERQHAFLSIIFPHAHRWRKAAFQIEGAAQALEPMTTLSAPLLESLSLRASSDPAWAGDEPLDIFGGRPPPRLQELSLIGIPVSWNPKTLCNLKSLEIISIEQLAPSLDQLFAILPASPGLESLSIINVTFSGGASAPIPNPIYMPTLGKLSLEVISPEIVANRILAAIRTPKCEFGSLRSRVLVDPFETLFTPDISHFFDHLRSGAGYSSVYCGAGRVTVSWVGPWNISLDVENIRMARRVLDWLSVSPEPNSPAVPLYLNISEGDPLIVEDILETMTDTQAVHRIEFGYHAPLAAALGMLAAGGLGEGSARTPFPGLTEISIRKSLEDDEWENLLRVFRSRQGAVEPRGGDPRLNPLRSLAIEDPWYVQDEGPLIAEFKSVHWPNRLEEIRRLLGHDGKLKWKRWMVAEDGTLEKHPGEWGYNH